MSKENNKALVCTKKGCKKLQIEDAEFCGEHAPVSKAPVMEVVSVEDVEKRVEREEQKYITYPRAQLDQIKDVYAKGASDVEFANFVLTSVRTGLDIFKKQIYLVKRWDSRLEKDVFTPQAGIDGFRAVAERTGKYAGNDDPIFSGEVGKEKYPEKAMVTVYKIVEGVRCPFTATARWAEYYPGEKIGFMWRSKPHVMLGKCAEALALRKAFPNVIQGFYESAEMDVVIAPNDGDKAKKGLEKIKELISKFTKEECIEYMGKIEKSDKYNEEQKKNLLALATARLQEVGGEKDNEESK